MAVLPPEEKLARFVFSRNHVRSNGSVKGDAFMPPPDLQMSVTRHIGFSELQIWNAGQSAADEINSKRAPDKKITLRGRADFLVKHAQVSGLEVVDFEPPPNHAHVQGWPGKEDVKAVALLLAAESKWQPVPVAT